MPDFADKVILNSMDFVQYVRHVSKSKGQFHMHMTQIFRFKRRLHVIVSVIILRSKKIGYTYTSSLALYYIFAKLPHLHTLVFSICQRHKDTFR